MTRMIVYEAVSFSAGGDSNERVSDTEVVGDSRGDTSAVRASEALDWEALSAYLREALPREASFERRYGRLPLVDAPVVTQFPGGHSNLTYLVRFGDVELVVRRPPLGPVPARAHDMAREFRWLAALHPLFPLAPLPLLLCEDPSVVGSTFYVMERRHGLVIRHDEPPTVAGRPEVRRAIGDALVDALAALHRVEARTGPLAALGKPDGFVERQVRGWTTRWEAARTTHIPEMATLATWLLANLPPPPSRPSVVHGDFKLDNVMLDTADPTRLVAVLDWEMCALGDPLVDLGVFLGYWVPSAGTGGRDALSIVTDRPGWPSRQAVIDRYGEQSGADLPDLRFYETFAVFKLAVVIQQIYVRYVRGQTDDLRFAGLGDRVTRLAIRAAELAEGDRRRG
jgi:aminoglycoside phosphotransferase (APT) family kinase protein